MTGLALTDPASAGAAGRCLAARVRDPKRWLTTDHASRCAWCDFPTPVLDQMLRLYSDLLGFDEVHGTYTAGTYEWRELTGDEQRAAVTVAQALEDEPPPAPGRPSPDPMAASSPPPAVDRPADPDPLRPDWAGGPS